MNLVRVSRTFHFDCGCMVIFSSTKKEGSTQIISCKDHSSPEDRELLKSKCQGLEELSPMIWLHPQEATDG